MEKVFISNAMSTWLMQALQREGVYLLPLRLFIGIGWLRAGLEKLADSSWHTGLALSEFFQGSARGRLDCISLLPKPH